MSIRDLTKADHDAAEQQPFVKIMFSGQLDPKVYAIFLWNQHLQYKALEDQAGKHGALDGLTNVQRAANIYEDFEELWWETNEDKSYYPPTLDTTAEFTQYIESVDDPKRLFAHCYTRHMGDMMGGQILAKQVPGKGKLYDFPNKLELQGKIRERLSDDLVDEVKVAYKFATNTFKEMWDHVDKS